MPLEDLMAAAPCLLNNREFPFIASDVTSALPNSPSVQDIMCFEMYAGVESITQGFRALYKGVFFGGLW